MSILTGSIHLRSISRSILSLQLWELQPWLKIGSSLLRLLGHHGDHCRCVLMQASLICIVVLPLELSLGPWSPSIHLFLVICVALVDDDDGKLSNCEGRLVMQFARYFLYFQLYLYLAYISPGFVLIHLYTL